MNSIISTAVLAPGAEQVSQRWQHDTYHWVRIDLAQRRLTNAPSAETYPLPYVRPIGQGIASMGGDFKCYDRTCHLLVKDGEIWTTGTAVGTSYVQGHHRAVIARTSWNVSLSTGDEVRVLDHVNAFGPGLSAYTSRERARTPSSTKERLRLRNPSQRFWAENGASTREYIVGLASSPVEHRVAAGEVELESDEPLRWEVGSRVTWTQSFNDMPRASEVISGMSRVVEGGVNVAGHESMGHGDMARDGYYFEPCPRAVIAVADGGQTAYMVVVDGKPGNEAGVRLPRLGEFLVEELGVDAAFNLDGGGSAVLWTKADGVVSEPSEGYVRPLIGATVLR